MLWCTAFTTRSVLNCLKIKNCISCDIDTKIDAKMEHICIVNIRNTQGFDPFNAWTTASLPIIVYSRLQESDVGCIGWKVKHANSHHSQLGG